MACKEEGGNDEVSRGDGKVGHGGGGHQAEDAWSDRFLVIWWWVLVLVSPELVLDDLVEAPLTVAGWELPKVTPKLR